MNTKTLSTFLLLTLAFTICNSQRSNFTCLAQNDTTIETLNFCPNPIIVLLDDLPVPFASESATKFPTVVPIPENATLNVPQGFSVNVYADNITIARWLALTPDGNVLVSLPASNQIFLLKDNDQDGVADNITLFADESNGLNMSSGMAFSPGFFYTASTNKLHRFAYEVGQENITGTGDIIATFPGGGNHWSRNIIISPDGNSIYVGVGSMDNLDETPDRALVLVMDLDGSNNRTFANGLRNPNGLDFHPVTGELYTTVNERDGLGDDLVPDYFTRIQEGEFFGFPYAYLSPSNIDPRLMNAQNESVNPELANETVTPDVLFQSHSAALGFKFYTGKTFPSQYRNGAFVAFHGSWNRDSGTGYKLVYVDFNEDNVPTGYYEDFLTGFLVDPTIPSAFGRPVCVLVHPDGSLLFTDDSNNRIYRVQYRGKHCPFETETE